MKRNFFLLAATLAIAACLAGTIPYTVRAQSNDSAPPENLEGTMTLAHMGEIIDRLDPEAKRIQNHMWQFKVGKSNVLVVTDEKHNRMRIMVAVRSAKDLTPEEMMRIMQANFDSALDSRYAVARDILWATFIHPLRTLHDKQFITAIGQTVNLAATYGTSYSSGLLTFGGGDSNAIIRRQLIDELLKKGTPI